MIILRLFALLLAFTVPLRAQLVISEFLASNSTSIRDEDGQHEDWIEIQNTTGSPVNLLGWYLTDESNQPRKWALPARTLNAGAYLVIFASGKDRKPASGNLHTSFKLNTSPDYLALTHDLAGGGVEVVTAFNLYPQQATSVSFGIASISTTTPLIGAAAPVKAFIPASSALGTTWLGAAANEPFDDSGWLSGTTGVGFGDGVSAVALANLKQRLNSDTAVDIVTDTSGAAHPATNSGAAWLATSTDTAGSPKTRAGVMQFVAAENDQVSTPGTPDFDQAQCTVTFWMRSAGITGTGSDAAMLWDRRTGTGVGLGTVITQHTSGKLFFQAGNGAVQCSFSSIASISDDRWHHVAVVMNTSAGGTNTFYVDGATSGSGTNTAAWDWTPSTPIELGRSHDAYWYKYNGLLDDVRFYNRELTFEEISQIAAGGDDSLPPGDIGLNVQSQMQNVNATAYIRVPFTVNDPAAITTLRLTYKWNDGFVAYVNGTQITSQNAPAVPDWNSTATGTHSASIVDTYDYQLPPGLLRSGGNVLAIQGLNITAADANFLISPKLDGLFTGVTSGYMAPTPGAANAAFKTNVGPFVGNVTKNPNPRPTGTAASPDLIITATVAPSLRPLATVSPVQLKYRIMYNAEQTLEMLPTGVADTFSAAIPTNSLVAGQMLRWRVVATDNSGAIGTGPEYSDPTDNEQYYGTAAVDSTIETNLPILYWFIQSTAALDGSDTPTRCSLFYKAAGDSGVGRFYDNVLVDRHGQSSGGFPKKSYNFDFNEDNRFEWDVTQKRTKDMDLLTNWGDKSKTHNQMTHEAFATVGSVHHWCHQVRVQQVTPTNAGNPANHFFSIADMMEDGDEDFMARNGRDPNGALYKIYDNLAGTGGAEQKTRLFDLTKADLAALIAGLNVSSPIATRRQFAYANLDLPQCVSYFVGCMITSHQDHGHKNYYVYRDTLGTREWSILPWDVDLTWGRNWQDSPGYFTDTIFTNNDLDMYNAAMQGKGENRLYSLFVGNSDISRLPAPEFRDMVLRRLRTVLDGYFSAPGVLENRFAQLADLMDPPAIGTSDADRDRAKWGTWGNDGGNAVGGAAMRYHINQIRNLYLPGRRTFLNAAALAGATVPPSQPADAANLITIETVDFNPTTGNQGHEYFVVRNSNSYAVDISGWKITGAIDWTFKPGTVLPGGGGVTEHRGDIFVAKDPFLFRQGATVTGGRQYAYVQGPYIGQLSARGESLELRDAAGNLVTTKSWEPAPTLMQSQLRITELHYAPTPATSAERAALPGVVDSDFEYLELINTGSTALDLTGAHFEAGIDFTFPAVFSLAAGARCLVVANLAAFQLRHGHGFDAQVAGAFGGNLDTSGERIQLSDNIGENILDFRYNPDWYGVPDATQLDGIGPAAGYSFVTRSINPAFDSYDNPLAWALSRPANGTPGGSDDAYSNVYYGWLHDHFTSAEESTAIATPGEDAEGDSWSNFAEYVFGGDPRVADAGNPLSRAMVTIEPDQFPAVRFKARAGTLDVTWIVEASSDGVAWRTLGPEMLSRASINAEQDELTFRDSELAGGGARMFRVKARYLNGYETTPFTTENHAPAALADTASARTDAVKISVLSNDTDPDNDSLVIKSVGNAAHGSAVADGDGSIIYTPDGTFAASGGDSFTYVVSDAFGGEAQGTVTVTFANSAPMASPDGASSSGEPVTISVLLNDTDGDGDPLTITDVTQGQHGTVSVNAGASVTFTPGASFPSAGGDLFTYTISDGYGGTSTGTVTVTALNAPPVANDDIARVRSGANNVPVLDNDTDPNGNTLTIAGTTNGSHGAVSISGTSVIYTANASFTGTDTFTYTISDGFGGTATATVKVIDELLASLTGTYRGLVSDDAQASLGVAEVKLSNKGKFTVQLWHSGERFGAKGQFDAGGAATLTVKGKGASRTLMLQLAAEEDSVSGTVHNGSASFTVSLKRITANFGQSTPCPQTGDYTALLPADPTHLGEVAYPQGCGYATMSVATSGSVKIRGNLGDASAFAIRGSVDQDGVVLMHTPLYKKPKGFICGEASFVSGDSGADQRGVLTWRKPLQQKPDSSYTAGLAGSTPWQAARFANLPKGAPIFGSGSTVASATMEFGGLAAPVTKSVTVSGQDLVVQNTGPDTLAIDVNGKSGLFSGSYVHPRDGKKHSLGGVLYQKLKVGRGTFTGISDGGQAVTGHWILEPPTP